MTIAIFLPSAVFVRTAPDVPVVHLLHKIKVIIFKINQILNGREYPGTAVYSMDATLAQKAESFRMFCIFFQMSCSVTVVF